MNLAEQIERHLLDRGEWVPARELCRRFGLTERQLRAVGDTPGLCEAFAISIPGHGYKHIRLATTAEFIHAKHYEKRRAIQRFRRVRVWDHARRQAIRSVRNPCFAFERDTGQGVLGLPS